MRKPFHKTRDMKSFIGTETEDKLGECTTFWNMMYQGLDVYLSVALTTLGVQELVH